MAWWIFWVGWIVVGVSTELYAVKTKKSGDTLSEQYWAAEKILEHWPWARWIFRVVTLGFLGWLGLHFLTHTG